MRYILFLLQPMGYPKHQNDSDTDLIIDPQDMEGFRSVSSVMDTNGKEAPTIGFDPLATTFNPDSSHTNGQPISNISGNSQVVTYDIFITFQIIYLL